MPDLKIRSNDRVLAAGRTGSGKTFLMRYLLARTSRLVVLDPKGTLGGADWGLADWSDRSARHLADGDPVRLRVPAPLDGDWNPYLEAVYRAGGLTLYLDEVYGVVPPGKTPPPYLTACYTRGRELGIGVFAATQRPAWVPLFALSEADWFFVFRLTLEDDRRRMASFMGPMAMVPIRDRYGFLSYHPEWEEPIYTQQLMVTQRRAAGAIQTR